MLLSYNKTITHNYTAVGYSTVYYRILLLEQREELHTVDRAMGVHRSSPTTRPVRALGGLVDHAVIGRATPRDRTGKVESNQGGKTMYIVGWEIATDERLSLAPPEKVMPAQRFTGL